MAGRLTAAERKTLQELTDRAQADADADDGYELTVKLDDGRSVTLAGAKARAFARKHGLDVDDDDDPGEGGDELGEDKKPGGEESGGYFKGRKAPKQA